MFERIAGNVGGPSLMEHMDLIKGAGACRGYDITWRISGSLDERELRNVNAYLDAFCVMWRPHGRSRVAEPRHYADLAYAWQCFELARDAEDGHVSDQFFYLKGLRDALGRLEQVEPRFSYAYCLAEYAVQLAGEFEIEDAMEGAWDELEAVMVRPLSEPSADEYAVVDDTQTVEDFAFTRMPDIDALSVQFTTEPEFDAEGRMVFAADLYPNYRDSTLIMDRHWRAGRFILHADIVDDGTELPYEILRDLRRGLDAHFSYLAYETSAVEYYLSCAHAQECTGILAGDPSRRDELVEAVGEALEHIVARNASAAHGRLLFDALTAAAEAGDDDAVFEYANALYFCIPRDFRVTFPTGNDDAATAVKDALFAAYSEQDIGFARVVNRQPPDVVPLLNHLAVDFLDTEGTAEDLPYANCFLIQDIESATRELY